MSDVSKRMCSEELQYDYRSEWAARNECSRGAALLKNSSNGPWLLLLRLPMQLPATSVLLDNWGKNTQMRKRYGHLAPNIFDISTINLDSFLTFTIKTELLFTCIILQPIIRHLYYAQTSVGRVACNKNVPRWVCGAASWAWPKRTRISSSASDRSSTCLDYNVSHGPKRVRSLPESLWIVTNQSYRDQPLKAVQLEALVCEIADYGVYGGWLFAGGHESH